MAKKKQPAPVPRSESQDKPATLKDLLSAEVLSKLQAQSDAMKAEEEQQREDARKQRAEARAAEQKRLENDFGHLLNNSGMDWKKYK